MTQQIGTYAQKERLAFIDFSLEYFGDVCRADLQDQFQIGLAAATRDFSLYREQAPDNLYLDPSSKIYKRADSFEPLFEHDAESVLIGLARGFGDGLSHVVEPSKKCFDAIRLIHPDTRIIAQLMRAIHQQKAIECRYYSISSGETTRTLFPHALVNNGHRWHVRAYDRKSESFRDFVCTRFSHITQLDIEPKAFESRESDKQWNRIVDLKLIPHPSLKHHTAIEMDYQMQQGSVLIEVRAALVGYLLSQWNVDCSTEHLLAGGDYQLALANPEALYGIENLTLLPAYDGDRY